METKFYQIRATDSYRNAASVYFLLPDNHKYKIENLISKEVYAALMFNKVISKIEDYCDKFFDCTEAGLSYELGCYFQKVEYQNVSKIERDITKFERLLKVYDSVKYPKEYKLLEELIADLNSFAVDWKIYEKEHPELFRNYN